MAFDAKCNDRFPKINPGSMIQPYISTEDGVARVDPSRLLNEEDRRSANQVRRVEDPVKVKEKAKKVGSLSSNVPYCL